MSEENRDWAEILANVDTKTKVLGLIALVAEALFVAALAVLRGQYALYALCACATILVVTIIGIVIIEVTENRARSPQGGPLTPTAGTPPSKLLNELINSAIETVCRAVSLPQTPQGAKLRVFIFRKEGNQLVCSHCWSQDPVKEQVGILRFDLNSAVAKRVAVVRAAVDDHICRTAVEPLPPDLEGSTGDVTDNLAFVLAAPIKTEGGEIWGTVDFDTASEEGKAILSAEVSNAVMFQLARHLSVIFELEPQQQKGTA
jgi:hypothetical protein